MSRVFVIFEEEYLRNCCVQYPGYLEGLNKRRVVLSFLRIKDNFSPDETKIACKNLRDAGFDKILIEVSGGINSENFLEYAGAQVNIMSMGELTQNVKSLNISLEVTSEK